MAIADKCPNCGAFLPPAQAAARKCDFCGLAVSGSSVPTAPSFPPGTPLSADDARAQLVERMRQLTAARAAGQDSTAAREAVRQAALAQMAARRGAGRAGAVFAVVGILFAVGVSLAVSRSVARRAALAGATAAAAGSHTATRESRDQYATEVRAAVAKAGGYTDLDAIAYLPFVEAQARTVLPDAALVSIQIPHVGAAGRANLTLDDTNGYYELRSPSASKRPPGTPVGVDARTKCRLQTNVGPKYEYPPSVSEMSLSSCRDPLVLPPRCTPEGVWKRALAAGAPKDAVADLRYDAGFGMDRDKKDPDVPRRGEWSFYIRRDEPDGTFSKRYPDDCGAPPAGSGAGEPLADDGEEVPPDPKVLAQVFAHRRELRACVERVATGHDAIVDGDATWRIELDAKGRVASLHSDGEMHIEGIFMGDLDEITRAFSVCTGKIASRLTWPAGTASPQVVSVRIPRGDGGIAPKKVTRGQVRAAGGKP